MRRRRCRPSSGCAPATPGAGIFAVALSADPDLILQAMRAGANEFFIWPPADETFHGAIRRTAARRETVPGCASRGHDARVLRRQGRRRHDDHRGELRRRACASEQAIDGDHRLEAGPRRSRAVSRHPAALQHPRRDRQPSPARSGIPARSSSSSTSPGWRFWPAPTFRPARGSRRQRHRGALPAAHAAIRVSGRRCRQPDQLVHRGGAVRGRSDVSRRESGRPLASATRNGFSSASASWAHRAIACGCCSIARPSPTRFRRSRSRRRSAIRFTICSRATTRQCRPRSIPAYRWR